jgi:hypothetical protein
MAVAEQLGYSETTVEGQIDDGNPAWETIKEEDQNIEAMRWAADDREDFGPKAMPTDKDAEIAEQQFKKRGEQATGAYVLLKHWCGFWGKQVSKNVLINVLI